MNHNIKTRLHKKVWEYLQEINNHDYTNPEVQRNIENYGVEVGGILVKKRLHWVFPGQSLSIEHWPMRDHGNFDEVKILFENDHCLVLFKPSGIVVQPGAGHSKDNLATWLAESFEHQQTFDPEQFPTRGLVHRIDKNTQGILLVAKSQKDLEFFQNQFKSRNVTKKYLCIADGVVEDEFVIKAFQTKHHNNVKKQILFWDQESATKYDPKSRYSESHIRPLAVCNELEKTLLEVEIKTGRMHQIRLHCQTLGFPLSNDLVYNSKPQGIQKFYQSDEQFETGWTKKISQHDVTQLSKNQFNTLKNETFAGHDYCLLSNVLSLKMPGEKNLNVEYFDIAKHLKKLKSE